MSDIQFTIDPSGAQQGSQATVKAIEDIVRASEYLPKRAADSTRRAAEKISKNLGIDVPRAVNQTSSRLDQLGKTYHQAGTAGAGLVNSQDQLSAAVRRTARSVAILQGPLGPIAGRITMIGVAVGDVGVALAAMGVTLAATIGVLLRAGRAGADMEVQFSRLNAVLRATGGTANQTSESVENLARNLGRYTLASTQEVRTAATQMLTFRRVTEDAFSRSISLAQDLAAVGFGSLEGAARQLARALEDPEVGLTALRRAGVSFTLQQRDMIVEMFKAGEVARAQGMILDEVAKQVGGAGVAAAVGVRASFDTLGEEMKLLLEEIGTGEVYRVFARVLDSVSSGLRTVAENAEVVTNLFKALTQALMALAAVKVATMLWGVALALKGVAAAAATYMMTVSALWALTGSLSAAFINAGKSAGVLGKALGFIAANKVLVAFVALTAAFYGFNRLMSDHSDVSRQARNAAEDLSASVGRVIDTIFARSGQVREGTIFSQALSELRSLESELENAITLYEQLEAAREDSLRETSLSPVQGFPILGRTSVEDIADGGSGLVARFFSNRKLARQIEEAEREIEEGLEKLAAGMVASSEELADKFRVIGGDTASEMVEGIAEGLADFNRGSIQTGIDSLEQMFTEANRNFQDIIKPTVDVDSLVADLGSLTEAVGPQVDRQTAQIMNLSEGIENAEAALDRYFSSIEANRNLLAFYEARQRDISERLKEGNLNFVERNRLNSELRQTNEDASRAQIRLNQVTADYDSIQQAVTQGAGARTAATDRIIDNLAEEIRLEQEKLDAMAISAEALATVELRQQQAAEATRLHTMMSQLFGETWKDNAELLGLVDRRLAQIQRRHELSSRSSGGRDEGRALIDRLREQIRAQEDLIAGVERASYEREVERAIVAASRMSNQQAANTIRELAEEYRVLASEVERRNRIESNQQAASAIRARYDEEYRMLQERLEIEREIDRLTNQPGGFSEEEASAMKRAAANYELVESYRALVRQLDPTIEKTEEYLRKVEILDEMWWNAYITGEQYLELMHRIAEAGEGLVEQSFWERWLEGAEDAFITFEEIATRTIDNFASGFGRAIEDVIFNARSIGDVIHGVAESMARSIIRALSEMAAQWMVYKLVQRQVNATAQMSAAKTMGANATAMAQTAGINAFASTAAIPYVGPAMAPGAMATALAATMPLAASVMTTALAGVAHGGIDRVPREGTWLLDRDERVLQPQANKDLTEFLKRQEEMQSNQAPQGEIRIVNVTDKDLVQDFMTGAEGDRVIVNSLRRNAGAIRQLLM